MENRDPFADLESQLDGTTRDEKPVQYADYTAHAQDFSDRTLKTTTRQRVEIRCDKCRGTGTFYSYSGRAVGRCFACNGTGKILRAAGYEQAKAARQERKDRLAREQMEAVATAIGKFAEAMPDVFNWIQANTQTFSFAASLNDALARSGTLTEGQINGVRKCLARDAERAQAQAEATAQAVAANPDALDISPLNGYYAVPDGATRLKLRVKHPGKNSRFHGWIFVDDGAVYGQNRKYGSQRPGALYQGQVQDQLRAILANPLEAQIAYGKLTGVCGVCGRPLEDAESVAAGIGPICRSRL